MAETKYKELVIQLLQTSRLHRKLAEHRAADMNIQPSQHRMLIHLSRGNGSFSQKDIAEMFDISPAAVATSMKKMEAAGYISRNKHARNDARYNNVFVTEKGTREVEAADNYFATIDKSMFENFTEEEIEQFISLLQKANSNLQKIENQQKEG